MDTAIDPALLDPSGAESDLVALTRTICDIPSVSGAETALADAIEALLRGYPHLEVLRDGDALVARTNLGRDRRVVVAGHIDTVPIADNLPTRLVGAGPDAVLWGRGTVDMLGGVAVALALATELGAPGSEPAHDLTWIFYDHEEVDSALNGLGRLARNHPELLRGDFAILGEPSNAGIEGGCNGTMRVELRTRGVAAHSARAWTGENAIHAAAPVLSRLAAYEPREVEVDGLVYREGLNAVRIDGGIAGNVIPDACTVEVNYRFAPSRSVEEAEAHLREVFEGFDLVVTDAAGGARPGLDDPLAAQFVESVLATTGGAPAPKYGWTDVARFSELGIPAVNFGPGDPLLAHKDDERLPVAQLAQCRDALRAWLLGG
ncbi:succinyldiaminopimelate desuccinylase [Promicromonospora umidemergens]|uniref:Succinyl-diaminopimelate desuccinylase n=1 Tax=Promicromonospora umidemergens TaxID=629679 RepID=A0ABP8Y1R0_9MICO|nr:succinyl-diaminopimelate desuccinylase [Promicromonospora umidemergens]MCP2286342.1 succinyldiaminopimelate desuccinylase [Promicromonospora umidemergens]